MVVDHLRASELFAIDTRTPEGLASLTAIFGQALQAGLIAGEAQREEEARKATREQTLNPKTLRTPCEPPTIASVLATASVTETKALNV